MSSFRVGIAPHEVVELARPFPANYVKEVQGNAYVPHHIVNQRLIHIFNEPPHTEILREITEPDGIVTGVVMRMRIGQFVVEEVGEADNPQAKTNGAKAKSAASDAYKRCAMRLGLGLHLWAQADYFLFDALTKRNGEKPDEEGGGPNHDVGKADGPAPPSSEDPKLKVKLLQFRARCIEKNKDADEEAAKLGIVSAERLNEEQLDRLLAEV